MPADTTQSERRRPADLDDYDIDIDDIFGDMTPPPGQEDEGKKRKALENADVDDDSKVTKRARAPRVKLDEQRLLSDDGIPKLRARAKGLKFKGKSHEFSDAARLLSFYQLWLDDLFPKARFLDALTMVEKTGHKTTVLNRRRDWIAEERRRELGVSSTVDDDHRDEDEPRGAHLPERAKEKTPAPADVGVDEDDIYMASPRRAPPPADPVDAGHPDDDDLEALMMEADNDLQAKGNAAQKPPAPDEEEFADEEEAMAEMGGLWDP